MKIIIDSSVWIAGIGSSRGYASEVIYSSYKKPSVEIFISDQILDEVTVNLVQKLRFDENLARKARMIIGNLCDWEVGIGPHETQAVSAIKYQKDKHILALCHKIQADYLITYDRKHLLPLKVFGKTIIVEPKSFVAVE